MSTPPFSSPWHFRHLGPDYFEPIFEGCKRVGVWPLIRVYTGKTGVPYVRKTQGRDVNPNWMVEDAGGHFRTNEGGFHREHRYDEQHVHTWAADDIARRFSLDL